MLYSSRFLYLHDPPLSGPDVKSLQERLKQQGFYNCTPDGIFGKSTAEALREFQKVRLLTVDGVSDPSVWSELELFSGYAKDLRAAGKALPRITVDIDKRKLCYASADNNKTYAVGVGRARTPSPLGHWTIIEKAPDPGGPFGSCWMRLSVPWGGYGIHGTDNPQSIGKAYSHGCIRLQNPDALELYNMTPIGTHATIIGKSYNGKVLGKGDAGAAVRYLQRSLKTLGYYKYHIDGKFNGKTERAVRDFQKNSGINPDGLVGNQTYIALQKALAIKRGEIRP
ncbi:MAG: peptidoglycan-binding protein [Syntrophomonadaceae bacterium]|nr:peptidoglycan-binding protein [Syntrophomonadaceae bacterium]